MHIAIFGGSFDPVHKGHLKVVNESLQTLDMDLLLITPAFISPFKSQTTASPQKRLEWLRTALPQDDKISICDFEILQNAPTPTIRTVRHVINEYAPQKLSLIVGADHVKTLEKWDEYQELCKLCTWVIASRDAIFIPQNFDILKVDYPASSSDVRNLHKAELLPDDLAKEILSYY